MDNRMSQSLDRYITGNYGEDQFGPPLRVSVVMRNKPRRYELVYAENKQPLTWDDLKYVAKIVNEQEE